MPPPFARSLQLCGQARRGHRRASSRP